MIPVGFQGNPFNITVIQVYAPTSNAEEAEIEQFYEDLLQVGKFGLGVQNEPGQRLTEVCQENALVIANTLFQQHKRRLYTLTLSDDQHGNQLMILFAVKDGEALYSPGS